jgi:O-antigen chain-terminating methyltransferase
MKFENHGMEISADWITAQLRAEIRRQQIIDSTISSSVDISIQDRESNDTEDSIFSSLTSPLSVSLNIGELLITEPSDSSYPLAQLNSIQDLINLAESRSQVRESLPIKRSLLYFFLRPFQYVILKLFNLIFRDQREVNANILLSLRESVSLNQQLMEQVNALRSESNRDLKHFVNVFRDLASQINGSIQSQSDNLFRSYQHLQSLEHQFTQNINTINEQLNQRLDNVNDQLNQRLDNVNDQLNQRLDNVNDQFTQNINTINEQLNQRLDNVNEQLNKRLDSVNDELKKRIHEHSEALRNYLQKLEQLEQKVQNIDDRNLRNDNFLRSDLIQQKRLLTLFLEDAQKRLPEKFEQSEIQFFSEQITHSLDALYIAFEDQFRGTNYQISQRLSIYLPFLENADISPTDDLIVDIGCGRGEWLSLLSENGYQAIGIDTNIIAIEHCQQLNFRAIHSDAVEYLKTLPDNSVAVVTGFHIIEHLPFDVLVKLLSEAYRVVRLNGLVIFETPNPSNVIVGSCNFYFDPTHLNPLPSLTTEFLVQYAGFSSVTILPLHPSTASVLAEESEVAQRFNEYFYGPMDYAIVGYKLT